MFHILRTDVPGYLDIMKRAFAPRWPKGKDKQTMQYACVQPPFLEYGFTVEQIVSMYKVFNTQDSPSREWLMSISDGGRTESVYVLVLYLTRNSEKITFPQIKEWWDILTEEQQSKFETAMK